MNRKTFPRLFAATVSAAVCLFGAAALAPASPSADMPRPNHASVRYSSTLALTDPVDETISYDHKTTEEYALPHKLPAYFTEGTATGCANVAGTEIIAYYDVTHEELIPDFQVYIKMGSVFRYKYQTATVSAVMNELAVLMGTDVGAAGTTFEGFQSGMREYASRHGGLTYSSESVQRGGEPDLGLLRAAVDAGKASAAFMPFYTVAWVQENENFDTVSTSYSSVAHVVAVYGYRVDTYYSASGSVLRTKRYLAAASGLNLLDLVYIDIDDTVFDETISTFIG